MSVLCVLSVCMCVCMNVSCVSVLCVLPVVCLYMCVSVLCVLSVVCLYECVCVVSVCMCLCCACTQSCSAAFLSVSLQRQETGSVFEFSGGGGLCEHLKSIISDVYTAASLPPRISVHRHDNYQVSLTSHTV